MKRYTTLLLPTMAVLGLVLQTSFAQADERERGQGPGKFFHELNLTPQQHKQIAELKLAEKKLVAPARAELSIKIDELRILWMSDNPSKKDIIAKQDEIAVIQKKIKEAKVDFHLGMLKILTLEQQKKAREEMVMRPHHKRFGDHERFREHGRFGNREGCDGGGPGMGMGDGPDHGEGWEM